MATGLCGARPPGARLFQWEGKKKLARRASPTSTSDGHGSMWGATAGRAAVPVGGQEEARAPREPHIDQRWPRVYVGRDRRARGCSSGRARRSSRGARAPHRPGWPRVYVGATAGRAAVASVAASAHTRRLCLRRWFPCRGGPCGRPRVAGNVSGIRTGGGKPRPYILVKRECRWVAARRPMRASAATQDPASCCATAGRARAPAPHGRNKPLSRCGAPRPPARGGKKTAAHDPGRRAGSA